MEDGSKVTDPTKTDDDIETRDGASTADQEHPEAAATAPPAQAPAPPTEAAASPRASGVPRAPTAGRPPTPPTGIPRAPVGPRPAVPRAGMTPPTGVTRPLIPTALPATPARPPALPPTLPKPAALPIPPRAVPPPLVRPAPHAARSAPPAAPSAPPAPPSPPSAPPIAIAVEDVEVDAIEIDALSDIPPPLDVADEGAFEPSFEPVLSETPAASSARFPSEVPEVAPSVPPVIASIPPFELPSEPPSAGTSVPPTIAAPQIAPSSVPPGTRPSLPPFEAPPSLPPEEPAAEESPTLTVDYASMRPEMIASSVPPSAEIEIDVFEEEPVVRASEEAPAPVAAEAPPALPDALAGFFIDAPESAAPEPVAMGVEETVMTAGLDLGIAAEPLQHEEPAPQAPALDAAPDFDVQLDVDVDLFAPPPRAPSARPAAPRSAPPPAPGEVASEPPGDEPRVDLGVAPPSEQGFADLALGDDELDDMFRDLEAPSEAPVAAPPPIVATVSAERLRALDDGMLDFGFESLGSVVEAPAKDDGEAELVIEGDEEEIELDVEAPAAQDRGAMLAATVTSRKRTHEASDALYGQDQRAEALARIELLQDEAGQDESYPRAAELLAVVAETVEGVLGDRQRARNLAERAYTLAPEVPATQRVLRRLDVAEGDGASAYARVIEELRGDLSAVERVEVLQLAAELAAASGFGAAQGHWEELSARPGVAGALSALFRGAVQREPDAMAEALARWSDLASGELAASLGVARARLVEARSSDDALEAIRDAVRRDPSDAGAWVAMARIALARVRADVFAEALGGLARAGAKGATSIAAEGIGRALDAVLGQSVAPGVVEDGGVSAWLVARAQEEAGVDAGPQVRAALEHARGEGLRRWRLRAGEVDADDDLGRFYGLRKAESERQEDAIAAASAAFLGAGDAVHAALVARAGEPVAAERALVGDTDRPLGAVLLAAAEGDARLRAAGEGDPLAAIEDAERRRRSGDVEGALGVFGRVVEGRDAAGSVSFAARAIASLAGDPGRVIEMFRVEAARATDPRRAATSRVVSASLATAYGVPDGATELVESAAALPGDLAVAELAALLALRGEIDPEVGAELLDQAAAAGDGRAHHTAAVRAALRRAAVDPDSATEAVWRAWLRCSRDASLGTLVLRSPAQVAERVVAVLRTQLEGAHAAGAAGVSAAIAEGLLLASVLEQAGRHAEAAQAVARTRTLALEDPSLVVSEERLWLKAGMFAEVAERAFDQLRAAQDDEQRVAAYERLAELDRTYRGDVASSVLSFQAILEIAPGHVASQRTLERHFIEQGRSQELLDVYRRMIEHSADADDALAYTHAAARLAVNLADGDVAAAGPLLRGAFARDLADRRLVVSLDAEARRTGDLQLFAAAHLRAAQLAGNDLERATAFVRAAEGFLALGDVARGREAIEHALAVDPNHLAALQHAAVERLAAGEQRAAADACETLGRRVRVTEHAVEFLQRAAAMWSESEPERALALAREVLEREPRHRPAWELAVRLARAKGDTRAEMELLALRTESPTEPSNGDRVALHQRAAELAQRVGDTERARAEWRKVIEIEPERIEALREIARLSWDAEDWPAAADACIRLAKSTRDTTERVEQLFRLGEIFDLRIPDPKRAEAAYRRVIQAAPDDVRTLERLVALFHRTGEGAKEYEVLQTLTARTMPGPARITRLLRVAELAEVPVADLARAELAYEGARREAPSDIAVLRAYANFLERSAAGEARKVLFERAGAEARRGVDTAPTEPAHYDVLIEVRRLRRDESSARAIASAALAVGVRSDLIDAHGTHTPEQPLGAAALEPAAVDLLSPPSIPPQLRALLSRTADVIAAAAPFEPRSASAEALGGRPHPLRPEIESWARLLGWPSIEIFVAADVPEVVRPIGGATHAFLVPTAVTPSVGLRFAVARAALLEAAGLGLAVRLSPREFAVQLAALLRQFEPMHRPPNVDPAQLDEHARRMLRSMSRERHAELSPLAFQVIERGPIDAEGLRSGAWELGNRLALLATDDMPAALALLAPIDGATPEQLASTMPLGRLLRASLNDRFAEARRVAAEAAKAR